MTLAPYDPLGPPPPTTERCSEATYVRGVSRVNLNLGLDVTTLLVVTNTGVSSRFGTIFRMSPQSQGLIVEPVSLPQLSPAGPDTVSWVGAASTIKAGTAGLTLVNTTPQLDRGGSVTVCNSDTRITVTSDLASLTYAQFDALCEQVRAHPKAKTYSGSHFCSPLSIATHPVNNAVYNKFEFKDDEVGTYTPTEILKFVGAGTTITERSRPMSCIFIVFDAPTKPQSYVATLRGSSYLRFPMGTAMSSMARPVPNAPEHVVNHARAISEHVNSGFKTAAEVGVALAAQNAASRVVQSVASYFRGPPSEIAVGLPAEVIEAAGAGAAAEGSELAALGAVAPLLI